MPTSKTVVVLSDMHVGHRLAVMPETFLTSDGMQITPNRPQAALYKAWESIVNEWHHPDILVVNGEPIDGQQRKDLGVEAWTTNYLDQVRAAVRLVQMFEPKKVYLTRGSNYHVNVDGVSVEEIFGEYVGAEESNGVKVLPELFLEIDGVVFNFAHHIPSSASGWMYRSTPSAKEAMLLKLSENRKWPTNVIVRSHVHYYWVVESASHLSMTTPCWQLQTWYQYRKSSAGTIPDIGAVRFKVKSGEYAHEKRLFKMQEWRPVKVRG